jgi:hypothetical protein
MYKCPYYVHGNTSSGAELIGIKQQRENGQDNNTSPIFIHAIGKIVQKRTPRPAST